jgi:signal transduction histidine kinase
MATAAYLGLTRWKEATNTWARSAEVLIARRDLSTLEALTELLRSEYPSAYLEVREHLGGHVLWNYPDGSGAPLEGFSRELKVGNRTATVQVRLSDLVGSAGWMAAGLLALLVTSFGGWAWMLRISTLRIIDELDRLKRGEKSGIQELVELVHAREEAEQARASMANQARIGALITQVAHDIRSPLTALNYIVHSLPGLPDTARVPLMRVASTIQQTAARLLEARKSGEYRHSQHGRPVPTSADPVSDEPRSRELVSFRLDLVLAEKRMEYSGQSGIEIALTSTGAENAFVEVQPIELHRLISNLLTNGCEAITGAGKIEVALRRNQPGGVVITISDTGKGIPAELLPRLGRYGETHGKAKGNGLGLAHARAAVESWGGQLAIESTLRQGTTIRLEIPECAPPSWFVPDLVVPVGATVVILDDDESVHAMWRARLGKTAVLRSFQQPHEVLHWYRESTSEGAEAFYLLDLDIVGARQTGLDLAECLGLKRNAILVTNRADDPEVARQCEKLGLGLLPKAQAHTISVRAEMLA